MATFYQKLFKSFIDQGQQQQQQQPPPQSGWQQPIAELRSDFSGGSPCWVPASNGEIPPDAVEGGMDGMSKLMN